MFLLSYQKKVNLFIWLIANLASNINNIEAYYVIETVSRALRQLWWGGGEEEYTISWPGFMWPELPGSMGPEAVRWHGKKRAVCYWGLQKPDHDGRGFIFMFCSLGSRQWGALFAMYDTIAFANYIKGPSSPLLHFSGSIIEPVHSFFQLGSKKSSKALLE